MDHTESLRQALKGEPSWPSYDTTPDVIVELLLVQADRYSLYGFWDTNVALGRINEYAKRALKTALSLTAQRPRIERILDNMGSSDKKNSTLMDAIGNLGPELSAQMKDTYCDPWYFRKVYEQFKNKQFTDLTFVRLAELLRESYFHSKWYEIWKPPHNKVFELYGKRWGRAWTIIESHVNEANADGGKVRFLSLLGPEWIKIIREYENELYRITKDPRTAKMPKTNETLWRIVRKHPMVTSRLLEFTGNKKMDLSDVATELGLILRVHHWTNLQLYFILSPWLHFGDVMNLHRNLNADGEYTGSAVNAGWKGTTFGEDIYAVDSESSQWIEMSPKQLLKEFDDWQVKFNSMWNRVSIHKMKQDPAIREPKQGDGGLFALTDKNAVPGPEFDHMGVQGQIEQGKDRYQRDKNKETDEDGYQHDDNEETEEEKALRRIDYKRIDKTTKKPG